MLTNAWKFEPENSKTKAHSNMFHHRDCTTHPSTRRGVVLVRHLTREVRPNVEMNRLARRVMAVEVVPQYIKARPPPKNFESDSKTKSSQSYPSYSWIKPKVNAIIKMRAS